MDAPRFVPSRRLFLASAAIPLFTVRGAFANLLEDLTKTPAQTEGPFYPDKLPLDTDNDLIIVNDGITPAVGEITHLTGRILDAHGQPDPERPGRDLAVRRQRRLPAHRRQRREEAQQDGNFQGFGRFLTGSSGEYYFRTIKPVPYPGRTPHIHFKIKQGRQGTADDAVLHQGRIPATRRTASGGASARPRIATP